MRRGNLGLLICLLHFPSSKPLGLQRCAFPWGVRFYKRWLIDFSLSPDDWEKWGTAHLATPQQNMNVSEVQHVYPVYFIVFQPFKTRSLWSHWLAPCKAIWISKSEKFLLSEFEILGFGIWNSFQRIRNPANVWNLGSKFHLQGIRNPFLVLSKPLWLVRTVLCRGVGIAQFLFNRRLVVAPVRNTKKLNWSLFWITLLMDGCASKILFWFLTMKYICSGLGQTSDFMRRMHQP